MACVALTLKSVDSISKYLTERRNSKKKSGRVHMCGLGPYRRTHSPGWFCQSQSELPGLLIPGKCTALSHWPSSFLQPLADLVPAVGMQLSKSLQLSSACCVVSHGAPLAEQMQHLEGSGFILSTSMSLTSHCKLLSALSVFTANF